MYIVERTLRRGDRDVPLVDVGVGDGRGGDAGGGGFVEFG